MERQWIRNLALSEYSPQGWELADPNGATDLALNTIQGALSSLQRRVKDAVDVFNYHADGRKQMRLFNLTKTAGANPCGFAIMIKDLQIKIEVEGSNLRMGGILMRGYQANEFAMRVFTPKFDHFGEVVWMVDEKTPADLSRLARQILEDTVRMAYETGVIAPQRMNSHIS